MAFADNLKTLPGVSHLAALNLIDAADAVVAARGQPGIEGIHIEGPHIAPERRDALPRGEHCTVDGERLEVTGEVWMDHQWGNFISVGATGWDWFSVQMENNEELTISLVSISTWPEHPSVRHSSSTACQVRTTSSSRSPGMVR